MKARERSPTTLIAGALVFFLVVDAVYLWFIDLLAEQREFGVFLAAELTAFSMLVYLCTRTSYDATKKSWLLLGCLGLVFLLTLALI